jgi:predicted N-acetyltransferase YhbS
VFSIRPAEPRESEALSDLARRAKAHWGYPAEWIRRWDADLHLSPDYITAHDVFVATAGDRIVGVCALERHDSHVSLEHMWIDPDHHRQGIGRALVRRVLDAAADAGASTIVVHSDPFAEPFYLRLGARRVGALSAPMPGAPDRALPILEFVVQPM